MECTCNVLRNNGKHNITSLSLLVDTTVKLVDGIVEIETEIKHAYRALIATKTKKP